MVGKLLLGQTCCQFLMSEGSMGPSYVLQLLVCA